MAFRSKTPRTSRLMIETLEGRDVPASLVVGAVVGGVLTLTGDDQANEFVLKDTGADMVVTATNADTQIQGTLPAGSTQTFLGVNAVKLVLKGGSDVVASDATAALTLTGAFAADMGDGDNALNLNVGTGAASIGSLDYKGLGGDDTIILGAAGFDTTVNGKVAVSGGDGDNATLLVKATVKGDLTHTGLEGDDVISLTTTTVDKNVSLTGGAGDGSAALVLSAATVTGNASVKGVGNSVNLQTLGTLSKINGAAGATLDGGVTGNATVLGFAPLTVTNGGLTLKGKNATSSVRMFATALVLGKDLTVSNHIASVTAQALSAKGVTVSGVDSAEINISGVATLTGGLKATSSSGDADIEIFGASADIAGAVSATGPLGARVSDGVSGVSHFRSTVAATAARGSASFEQGNNSTLTVDGTLTVKGFFDADITVDGSNEKKLMKDVSVTATVREVSLNVDGGKTTFGGNLAVKGYESTVTLSAGSGSTVAKNFTLTGGADDDGMTWDNGFNVLGNATLSLGAGETSLVFGGGATTTEVKNLTVTAGNAADEIFFDNFKVNGTTAIKMAGGNDDVEIDKSTFVGAFTLDTGDADDTLSIAQNNTNAPVTFTGKATIKLGAGNDTLELGTPALPADLDKAIFSAIGSTIDGGLGYNVYEDDLGQGLATANLTLTLFTNPL